MKIRILGAGCSKCEKQRKNLDKALADLGLDAQIENVEELKEIVSYGVMTTPSLVINEKLVAVGKVVNVRDLKKLLSV